MSTDSLEYLASRYGDDRPNYLLCAAALMAVIAIGTLVYTAPTGPSIPPITSAHVKVETKLGHGSATHIGEGLYVTAAHVVGSNKTAQINGVEVEALWANDTYDIAVLSGPNQAASVPLACYTPTIGETGEAHGNPMAFNDITTRVVVAGAPATIGEWKVAVPVDGTVGPGMSGGAFVIGGALVGVNVGAALAPAGSFPSYFGLSIIVPGSVVCDLLGRK